MKFRNYILYNFPFLEDDFDALTDYQLFCKMVAYMKKALDKINGYQEELDAFKVQLDTYENYFENLDVTEEVNAKLDEMVENGTMERLIGEYLQLESLMIYDSVADMKLASNLVDGMIVQTSGYYSYNDGGGSYYKIRNLVQNDVIDDIFLYEISNTSLVAEFIPYESKLNIVSLGCKGDNDFDNTTRLQAIINKAQTTGYPVIIPVGEFKISDTLYITDKIMIEGIGTNRLWSGTSKHPLLTGYLNNKPFIHISRSNSLYNWDTARNNLVENVHIKNLRIIGSQSGNFSITGIYANTYLSTFENLCINGFINDMAIAGSYETLITNCQFTQSYQCLVSFDNNRTTIFRDCWMNSSYHTAGSIVSDNNYTTLYVKNHMFNYCAFYSNLSYHFFDNLALENSCYGIISRDSKLIGNGINAESISECYFHNSLNLRPNDSYLDLDNIHIWHPATVDFNNAKMIDISYHSRISLKFVDALPITNLSNYGTIANNSIARIYSYMNGERVIPLTLSSNVTNANIINKSHYTRRGFMIDYEFKDQDGWSTSSITTLSGLPASTLFTSSDYYYFINGSKTNDKIRNMRINGAGAITNASGTWTGGSDNLDLIVKIKHEYDIQ